MYIKHRTMVYGTAHCFPLIRFVSLCQAGKNAFFIADLGVVMRQHVRWRTHMAQIRPYYSVRCNSRPTVIDILAALGTGFICTNKVFSRACLLLSVLLVFETRAVAPPSGRQVNATFLSLGVKKTKNNFFSVMDVLSQAS